MFDLVPVHFIEDSIIVAINNFMIIHSLLFELILLMIHKSFIFKFIIMHSIKDRKAEWSKGIALCISPEGRGFKPNSVYSFNY